ncbi:MAG: alpha/beta hydrolase, partial [Bacteroidales bacterium]|nr:alpha/beta hydrolase [Bacteroidales bacterium]
FNVEDQLPRISPRAVFVGHGYYNELHHRVEAEEAYRLAGEPKQLYYVNGKHNEWMFDGDAEFNALCDALCDFFAKYLKATKFGLQ